MQEYGNRATDVNAHDCKTRNTLSNLLLPDSSNPLSDIVEAVQFIYLGQPVDWFYFPSLMYWTFAMDKYLDQSLVGQFSLHGVSYPGLITLSDSTISLAIYVDSTHISLSELQHAPIITGILFDLTKVTLLGMVFLGRTAYQKHDPASGRTVSQQFNFEFRYALFSNALLDVEQPIFNSSSFSLPNSSDLFCFESFSQVVHATESLAKDLLKADFEQGLKKYGFTERMDTYRFGSRPEIYIYTGAEVLIDCQLPFGNLVVRNSPSFTAPSNSGFSAENNISCEFELHESENFWTIVEKIRTLQNLLVLLLGRKQVLTSFNLMVETKHTNHVPHIFKVYHAIGDQKTIKRSVDYLDRLVQVEIEIDEFNTIVNNWFLRQENWKFARSEFFTVFNDFKYSSDTLIKLSNLFDILPSDTNKKKAPILSDELKEARDKAVKDFSDLVDSPEKKTVLNILRKIGNPKRKTLRDRILERYSILSDVGFVELNEIDTVVKQIVRCRNFFVHGDRSEFDYLENTDLICFFIDTLFFIYAASEMIESGWRFNNWEANNFNEHPFSMYITSYNEYVVLLNKVIGNNV